VEKYEIQMKLLLLILFLLINASATAESIRPYFKTKNFVLKTPVTLINQDTGQEYFLIGLHNPVQDDKSLEELNDTLAGEELGCTGSYNSSGVWCNYGSPRKILAETILNKGLALEDCQETGGQFGTCEP
jgi:hypothetical protein